jgi:hypothetical protein
VKDYVHEHFCAHTPADADENWETEHCVGGYERRYKGTASNIFPRIVCADGFALSVQGHFGAYSSPRSDFAREYSRVEVLCPETPEFAECSNEEVNGERLYGYVPVHLVNIVIAFHGGPRADAMLAARGEGAAA